jgi:hypothetical protein
LNPKHPNWGALRLIRRTGSDSAPPRLNGARPEVLPQDGPETKAKKKERAAWLADVMK